MQCLKQTHVTNCIFYNMLLKRNANNVLLLLNGTQCAVRKAKIGRYAVRMLQIKQYAIHKSGGGIALTYRL